MGSASIKTVSLGFLLAVLPFVLCLWSPDIAANHMKYGIRETLSLLPYAFLMAAASLALQIRQPVMLCLATYFSLAYCYLRTPSLPAGFELTLPLRAQLLSLCIPVSLILFFFALRTRAGWLRRILAPLALITPPLAFATAVSSGTLVLGSLPQWRAPLEFGFFQLPAAGLVLWLFFLYSFVCRWPYLLKAFHAVTTLSTLPVAYVLGRHADPFLNLDQLHVETSFGFVGVSFLLIFGLSLANREESLRDALTGLPNLNALHAVLARMKRRYAIAAADVDFITKIERIYGREEARNAVRFVASQLQRATGGRAFRNSQGRFSVVLENRDDFELAHLMKDVNELLSQREFYIRRPRKERAKTSARDRNPMRDPSESERLQLSLSVGVAGRHERQRPLDVFRNSLLALQSARNHGGSQVALAGAGPM